MNPDWPDLYEELIWTIMDSGFRRKDGKSVGCFIAEVRKEFALGEFF